MFKKEKSILQNEHLQFIFNGGFLNMKFIHIHEI